MPSFQIRFSGVPAPDPETVVVSDASGAVRHAIERLAEFPGVAAVVLFGGCVVQHINPPCSAEDSDEERGKRYASAGIYWIRDA